MQAWRTRLHASSRRDNGARRAGGDGDQIALVLLEFDLCFGERTWGILSGWGTGACSRGRGRRGVIRGEVGRMEAGKRRESEIGR